MRKSIRPLLAVLACAAAVVAGGREASAQAVHAATTASGSSGSSGSGTGTQTGSGTGTGSAPQTGTGSDSSAAPPAEAYSLLTADGRLVGFGGAFTGRVAAPASPVVGVASTPDGQGAYAAEADGSVVPLGDAVLHGSMAGVALTRPIVGVAVDQATGGYWLVASDGGIFSFGGAPFFGSTGAIHLAKPIVGMSATPDGRGYRLVASDGGIFSFGRAPFYGSAGTTHLTQPVVGMATTATGAGYWLVASDGGIFSYGDARFYGSTGAVRLTAPIIAMNPTGTGHGYWMVASDGGIFNYGDAPFDGSGTALGTTILGMATGSDVNYNNPLRALTGLIPERVDEGVDYSASGPIYALGDGIVLSTTGSWPGGAFIAYRLTDGPAKGKIVYAAENITPAVSIGQTVTPATVLGTVHAAWPGLETGWAANGYGETMAAAAGQWTPSDDSGSLPTAYGVNFNSLLVSLGAPGGVLEHATTTGVLAAGWPGA